MSILGHDAVDNKNVPIPTHEKREVTCPIYAKPVKDPVCPH